MSILDEIKTLSEYVAFKYKFRFAKFTPLKNEFDLSKQFINEWVAPYHLIVGQTFDKEGIDSLIEIKPKITPEVIKLNLGDSNWRSRQTGAYFAAITNRVEFIDVIGTHLLKSEGPYAGRIYCLALSHFNTTQCVNYINKYLEYYLDKPDLCFDQRDAMQAISYLDKINNTNQLERHWENWLKYISNKPHWNKEISTEYFEKQIEVIKNIAKN